MDKTIPLLELIDFLILNQVSLSDIRDISSKDLVSHCIILFAPTWNLLDTCKFIVNLADRLSKTIDLCLLNTIILSLLGQITIDFTYNSRNLLFLLINFLNLGILVFNYGLKRGMGILVSSRTSTIFWRDCTKYFNFIIDVCYLLSQTINLSFMCFITFLTLIKVLSKLINLNLYLCILLWHSLDLLFLLLYWWLNRGVSICISCSISSATLLKLS